MDVQVDNSLQFGVGRHRSVPHGAPEHCAVVLLGGVEGEDGRHPLVGQRPHGLQRLMVTLAVPPGTHQGLVGISREWGRKGVSTSGSVEKLCMFFSKSKQSIGYYPKND
jgi:hypothetical protein